MITICVESAQKSKMINRIISKIGAEDIQCIFVAGRIFDYNLNSQGPWDIINPDVHSFLKKQIQASDTVIAMTDSDHQGELIAFQINEVANGIPCIKADLPEISVNGIRNAIKNGRSIDNSVVMQTLAQRLLNYEIAQQGINQKIGPISIPSMVTALELEKGEQYFQQSEIVDYDGQRYFAKFLSKDNERIDIPNPIRHLPPTTEDVLLDNLLSGQHKSVEVLKIMQAAYELGDLSYSRTPSNEWHSEAVTYLEDLLESESYLVNTKLLGSHINNSTAHSALYLLNPELGQNEVFNQMIHRTFSAISKGERSGEYGAKLQLKSGGFNYHFKPINSDLRPTKTLSTPEQTVFRILKENTVTKPSTHGVQTTKLSNLFWDENLKIKTDHVQALAQHARKYHPELTRSETIAHDIDKLLMNSHIDQSQSIYRKAQDLKEQAFSLMQR